MSCVFSEELVNSVAKEMKVADLANATIGDVLLVASRLEELTGIPRQRKEPLIGEWAHNIRRLPEWEN